MTLSIVLQFVVVLAAIWMGRYGQSRLSAHSSRLVLPFSYSTTRLSR